MEIIDTAGYNDPYFREIPFFIPNMISNNTRMIDHNDWRYRDQCYMKEPKGPRQFFSHNGFIIIQPNTLQQ